MSDQPHQCWSVSATSYLRNLEPDDLKANAIAVHYSAPPKRNDDGTTSISLTMPMLLVTGYASAPQDVADRIAEILNAHWDSHGQPDAASLVPGVLQCAKCQFRLIKTTLNVADGNAYANNEPDVCPNCNVPMWRVSWRDEAEYSYKVAESQLERALKAEDAVAELKQRPTEDAYLRACMALHWRTAQLRVNGIEPVRIEEGFSHYPDDGAIAPSLPQDVIDLVIAAREAWEVHGASGDAVDRALERFAARVPFDNQPDEVGHG